jgi:hypothetical protein
LKQDQIAYEAVAGVIGPELGDRAQERRRRLVVGAIASGGLAARNRQEVLVVPFIQLSPRRFGRDQPTGGESCWDGGTETSDSEH